MRPLASCTGAAAQQSPGSHSSRSSAKPAPATVRRCSKSLSRSTIVDAVRAARPSARRQVPVVSLPNGLGRAADQHLAERRAVRRQPLPDAQARQHQLLAQRAVEMDHARNPAAPRGARIPSARSRGPPESAARGATSCDRAGTPARARGSRRRADSGRWRRSARCSPALRASRAGGRRCSCEATGDAKAR